MEDLRERDDRRESRSNYSITIRPNENFLYTYNSKRIKYGNFCFSDQMNFLEYYLEKMVAEGLPALSEFHFENTKLYDGREVVHVHGTISVTENEFKKLEDFAHKLNKKFLKTKAGKKPYVEFCYDPVFNSEGWRAYITKDIKHTVEEWTKGI